MAFIETIKQTPYKKANMNMMQMQAGVLTVTYADNDVQHQLTDFTATTVVFDSYFTGIKFLTKR